TLSCRPRALLATASTATPVEAPIDASANVVAGWACNRGGGAGHDMLRQVHGQFNRKFGSPRLTIARDQCYFVKCYGYYFGVCNHAGYTKVENAGDRNVAKDTNPNSGSACSLTPRPVHDPYLNYIFSRVNDISLGGRNNDVRSC
ncbi:hypothetical protein AJ78_07106, partial [Emergomyces pasteurianus Ep9510]